MLTLNANSKFQCTRYPAESKLLPKFAGKDQGASSQPVHTPLQQDLFQKAESRRLHEQSEQKLIQDWNQFKHRFDGYTAPAMKEAVQNLTDNLNRQAHISGLYTNGAKQRYEEHTPVDVREQHLKEQAKKPKFMVLL